MGWEEGFRVMVWVVIFALIFMFIAGAGIASLFWWLF